MSFPALFALAITVLCRRGQPRREVGTSFACGIEV